MFLFYVMKEEIVFIIPMRSYYPVQSHETLFECNLISPGLIASYGITCLCRDFELFSDPSASVEKTEKTALAMHFTSSRGYLYLLIKMMQHCLLLEAELISTEFYWFSTELNEAAAAGWWGDTLKMSVGAGDAHRPLPGYQGEPLPARQSPPQNKREQKTE